MLRQLKQLILLEHLALRLRHETLIESSLVLQRGNQMGKVDAIHGQLNASSKLRYHLDELLF